MSFFSVCLYVLMHSFRLVQWHASQPLIGCLVTRLICTMGKDNRIEEIEEIEGDLYYIGME